MLNDQRSCDLPGNTLNGRMFGRMDEQTLIQSARKGDLEAFNDLILRHQDLLFRLALGVLGDEDSAADATQTALISAFRKFSQFRGEHGEPLRSWLARMVVNACYDEIRRRRSRREVPLMRVDADGQEVDLTAWLADPLPGPELQTERNELEQAIHECLQTLEPIYRLMLMLVDIEGMTYDEAARAAGIPLGTVKSRLARARLTLCRRLREIPDLLPVRYSLQISLSEQPGVRVP